MRVVCSYCQKEMGEKKPLENKSATHTICPVCYKTYSHKWLKWSYADYLKDLALPAFALDREFRILALNEKLKTMFAHGEQDQRGFLCGEVICCEHSIKNNTQGCGETEHCKECQLRKTVTEVFETGVEQTGIFIECQQSSTQKFRLSARKKSGFVIVELDKIC